MMSDGGEAMGGAASVMTAAGYIPGKALGEGSFGKVVHATHASSGQSVAIKVFDKAKLSLPKYKEQRLDLEREGEILRRLTHDNIIWLFQVVDTPQYYCLVTERAEVNLLELLAKEGPFSERRAKRLTRQLASAIEFMHTQNVVHRDLKPDNLMIGSDNRLRVIDFGLSNVTAGPGTLLETQCGTMCYSAPEMLCNKSYGREVDVWSIGVCLYVMLTRCLPYESKSLTDLHAMMLDGAFQPPPSASKPLTDLLRRLFEVKPSRRITIAEMWEHEWLEATGAVSPPPEADPVTEGGTGGGGGQRGGTAQAAAPRARGSAVPPRRRPSTEHLNQSVVAAMVDGGLGTAAEIATAVRTNACNRLCAEYTLRTLPRRGLARDGSSGSLTTAAASGDVSESGGKWYRQSSATGGRGGQSSGGGGGPHGATNAIPLPLRSRDRVADVGGAYGRPRTAMARRASASAILADPHTGRGSDSSRAAGLALRPRTTRGRNGSAPERAPSDIASLLQRSSSDGRAGSTASSAPTSRRTSQSTRDHPPTARLELGLAGAVAGGAAAGDGSGGEVSRGPRRRALSDAAVRSSGPPRSSMRRQRSSGSVTMGGGSGSIGRSGSGGIADSGGRYGRSLLGRERSLSGHSTTSAGSVDETLAEVGAEVEDVAVILDAMAVTRGLRRGSAETRESLMAPQLSASLPHSPVTTQKKKKGSRGHRRSASGGDTKGVCGDGRGSSPSPPSPAVGFRAETARRLGRTTSASSMLAKTSSPRPKTAKRRSSTTSRPSGRVPW